MTFKVDTKHRCFREVFQFFVHTVSIYGHRYPHILERGAGKAPLPRLEERDFLAIDGGTPTVLRLFGVQDMLAFIKTGDNEPTQLEFDYARRPDNPSDPGLQPLAPGIVPTLCNYLLGYAWERHWSEVHAEMKQLHGKEPFKWDADIQFFRHIRNGCFHGGSFSIREKPIQIQAPNLPKWHGITITSRKAVEGKRVINDGVLNVSHVPHLLHDMGKALDRVLP